MKPICYSIYLRINIPRIKPLVNKIGGTDRLVLGSSLNHQETITLEREELSILTLLIEMKIHFTFPGRGGHGLGGGGFRGGHLR